jgi:hypothetical protein
MTLPIDDMLQELREVLEKHQDAPTLETYDAILTQLIAIDTASEDLIIEYVEACDERP